MEIIKIILPVVIISLTVVYIVFLTNKKEKQDQNNNEEDSKKENNYMTEGMSIGMCWGTAIAIIIDPEKLGLYIPLGMMFGMLVGMNIKK